MPTHDTRRYVKVIWWTWKPWKWRPYLVRKSEWGPFGELHLGFVSILWKADGDALPKVERDYEHYYGDQPGKGRGLD